MYSGIGQKVKDLRREHSMTLKDLSAQTGLSVSFISQLERGLTTIAIDSLDSIASVFNVPITSFFVSYKSSEPAEPVTRKYRRVLLTADSASVQYSLSTNIEGKRMFPCFYELPPSLEKETLEQYSHAGEEFVYVLSGILTLTINGALYSLYPGDCFHIDAKKPHNIQNNTPDTVCFISVVTPTDNGELVSSID